MNEDWLFGDDEDDEVSEIDDLIRRWFAGEDVSDDEVWEKYDEKYSNVETYAKDDNA
jgi:hypothetical protein